MSSARCSFYNFPPHLLDTRLSPQRLCFTICTTAESKVRPTTVLTAKPASFRSSPAWISSLALINNVSFIAIVHIGARLSFTTVANTSWRALGVVLLLLFSCLFDWHRQRLLYRTLWEEKEGTGIVLWGRETSSRPKMHLRCSIWVISLYLLASHFLHHRVYPRDDPQIGGQVGRPSGVFVPVFLEYNMF